MPTAQARMTRARGLHATRSRIRSDSDTSSLPERRIACRFFLFKVPMASCAYVPHPEHQDTATSTDRWRSSQARMTCARCHGDMCMSGEPLGAAATRRLGDVHCFLSLSSRVLTTVVRLGRTVCLEIKQSFDSGGAKDRELPLGTLQKPMRGAVSYPSVSEESRAAVPEP
jgi:hypothetical protein